MRFITSFAVLMIFACTAYASGPDEDKTQQQRPVTQRGQRETACQMMARFKASISQEELEELRRIAREAAMAEKEEKRRLAAEVARSIVSH